MANNEKFNYTYSAKQQKEIEEIRKKYLPKEADKMEQLQKLHKVPTKKARRAALILGAVGALIMGAGMSLCMTEIGTLLGSYGMIVGIAVGIAGMVPLLLAYPVYNRVLKKERRKIAPEILRLSEELIK